MSKNNVETLQEYAAGAVQKGTRRVGNFLAPTVLVPTRVGIFKRWTDKSRFCIPATLRTSGAGATPIVVDADDVPYDCSANALDTVVDAAALDGKPLDLLTILDVRSIPGQTRALAQDGADLLGDIYGLAHLHEAVTIAKEAAGAGTDVNYNAATDPVEIIDAEVEAVQRAGKCEQVGVLFGAAAWRRFKNHPLVRGRGLPLKWELNPALFTADAEYMGCFALVDTAPEGIAPVIEHLLSDEVLIFGRHPVPHRRDPSFMKTLRHEAYTEKLRLLPTKDGRHLQVLLDWNAEIQVTNAQAVKRINYLPAA
jgi:hypothetical protein